MHRDTTPDASADDGARYRESSRQPRGRAPPAISACLPHRRSSLSPSIASSTRTDEPGRGRRGLAGLEDRAGHVRERILAHDGATLERDARHPVDQRALLVLAERRCAGTAKLEQTLGAVLAHAGED